MPEFTLNSDARFEALPEFTKGYVEALFFTNGDTGADDEDKLNRLGTARLTAKHPRHLCRVRADPRRPAHCRL